MTEIGVVGYSDDKKFNHNIGYALTLLALEIASKDKDDIMIVSGLTNVGIPAIAYDIAKKNKWKTKGIACKLAEDYECFPVDEKEIIGDNWGDESETFLNSIDMLVRIGGGEQSEKETEMAKKRNIEVLEYDL